MRGVAADAQRFTGSLLDLLLDVPATFFQNTNLRVTKSLVPIPVPMSRVNDYSGVCVYYCSTYYKAVRGGGGGVESGGHVLRETTLSVDLSLGELSVTQTQHTRM